MALVSEPLNDSWGHHTLLAYTRNLVYLDSSLMTFAPLPHMRWPSLSLRALTGDDPPRTYEIQDLDALLAFPTPLDATFSQRSGEALPLAEIWCGSFLSARSRSSPLERTHAPWGEGASSPCPQDVPHLFSVFMTCNEAIMHSSVGKSEEGMIWMGPTCDCLLAWIWGIVCEQMQKFRPKKWEVFK